MTSAIRAGDTYHAQWLVGGDLTGATVVVVLKRRQMGTLGAARNIAATFAVDSGVTTVDAVLPADLATGEYAVSLRITRSGEVSTTPAGSNRSLTVWP